MSLGINLSKFALVKSCESLKETKPWGNEIFGMTMLCISFEKEKVVLGL